MDLVTPDLGLLFWMLVSFSVVFFILKKFAWPVILRSLKEREESIDQALHEAEKAREEVANLQSDSQRVLQEVQQQRDDMLKETRRIKESLLEEARQQAAEERRKMLAETADLIASEKAAASDELKREMAAHAVAIARMLLKKELTGDQAQQTLIDTYLKDLDLQS
ncbi:MAG: F0F1 ATP synthase subunit B [Bacteroidales bacterium]|nr:F0F1 ATP synthase subunit B [Bacteroidales bacterium]